MHNFVISLKKAVTRREHIQNQFQHHQINYTFFDALFPSNELYDLIKIHLPNLIESSLTITEKACFMSHIMLIKQCIENNLMYFSIFEDDVLLGKNSIQFLNHSSWIAEEIYLEKNAIIKLEAFPQKVLTSSSFKRAYGRKIVKIKSQYVGSAAYILSIDSAQRIIKHLRELPPQKIMPFDELLFNYFIKENILNVYQIFPALAIQERFFNPKDSTLGSEIELDRKSKNTPKSQTNKTLLTRIKKEIHRLFDKRKKIPFK